MDVATADDLASTLPDYDTGVIVVFELDLDLDFPIEDWRAEMCCLLYCWNADISLVCFLYAYILICPSSLSRPVNPAFHSLLSNRLPLPFQSPFQLVHPAEVRLRKKCVSVDHVYRHNSCVSLCVFVCECVFVVVHFCVFVCVYELPCPVIVNDVMLLFLFLLGSSNCSVAPLFSQSSTSLFSSIFVSSFCHWCWAVHFGKSSRIFSDLLVYFVSNLMTQCLLALKSLIHYWIQCSFTWR